MTRFNMSKASPQPSPLGEGALPNESTESKATAQEPTATATEGQSPSPSGEGLGVRLPIPCRSMAWFLNDQRRPEQARVDRIEVTHIAKENVYGDECPWNERIVYFVGRCQRLSTEVFATKEELINSLMQ